VKNCGLTHPLKSLSFAPEFQSQIAVLSTKQFFGAELWAAPNLDRDRAMPRNAQFIRCRNPQNLDPRNHWRYHHGMRSIDCQGIERL
jgi:hypothetical protein